MGQFSWLDCKNKEQITDNLSRTSYVLVPAEFASQYGRHIPEQCYDGYGHFGGYDVFELVAVWNREHIGKEDIRKPILEEFGGNAKEQQKYYETALQNYDTACGRIEDFAKGMDHTAMQEKYGENYLREIGIDIANDKKNQSLEYAIKITYDKDAVYEDCEPSLDDPHQGWEQEETYEEEYEYN